jgi:hypothetical protein
MVNASQYDITGIWITGEHVTQPDDHEQFLGSAASKWTKIEPQNNGRDKVRV